MLPSPFHLLQTTDAETLAELWTAADAARRENVGGAVHLRGLIEVSNWCACRCAYCGIRAENTSISRYRMELEEIVESAARALRFGYGSVVLQAGESAARLPTAWVTEVLRELRRRFGNEFAITLSLGERPEHDYEAFRQWREAGANRYLLRFETSNETLFTKIHPGHPGLKVRLNALRRLREIGFEIGSGVMVGIPGQTWSDLARDIETFREWNLDMIGVGPFLPHPETPLGKSFFAENDPNSDSNSDPNQVPNDELTTLKTLALTRLACPRANIPSTTALAVVDRNAGHELGLSRGANVIMPNVTPAKYRTFYEIYPSKASTCEAAEEFDRKLKERILACGREIGSGPGNSRNFQGSFFS